MCMLTPSSRHAYQFDPPKRREKNEVIYCQTKESESARTLSGLKDVIACPIRSLKELAYYLAEASET